MIEAELFFQEFEIRSFVRVDLRSRLNEFYDVRNDVMLGPHLNDARNNIATAFDNAKHYGLVVLAKFIFAAEKTFVRLDRLAGTAKRIVAVNVAHVFADQVAHAPSRFVGDAELALDLLGGHAVPRGAEQEHDVEPVPERRPGALKRRPGGRVELIAAVFAGEGSAALGPVIGRLFLALEAGQPVPEPDPHQVIEAGVIVGEPLVERRDIRTFLSHTGLP